MPTVGKSAQRAADHAIQNHREDLPRFLYGEVYPIDTLPDDIFDDTISDRDRWSFREALFWNDCQGWWIEVIGTYNSEYGAGAAEYWAPMPPDPTSSSVFE